MEEVGTFFETSQPRTSTSCSYPGSCFFVYHLIRSDIPCRSDPSDQLVSGSCHTLLNSPVDLTFCKRRPAAVAHGPILQPVAYLPNIHHTFTEELMFLYQIPRSARSKQPFARRRRDMDPVRDWLVHERRMGARERFMEGGRRIVLRTGDRGLRWWRSV